ncbi:S-layer homology domain-containing protein [Enorma phocaeensis]|uniref:S-layer homology domain-containing protein n=1 Tax=Enorma phocaeensis TaxID=1871019 RepID=UPI001956EC26|nr:S-layer homology domain-containing protein [Enorma phocaeensis]MBM6953981.1 S-layer homology domain-containing protein [Enorma phocaeensis]
MTACVNKKHTRRVALAISASLVGALSLGAAAPAVAFATNDGIQTLAGDTQDSLRDGKVTAWADQDGDGITATEFTFNGEAQYVVPTTVKPRENSAFNLPVAGYKVAYYKKTSTKDPNAGTDVPSDRSADGYKLTYIRDKGTIVQEGTYVAVVLPDISGIQASEGAQIEFTIVGNKLENARVTEYGMPDDEIITYNGTYRPFNTTGGLSIYVGDHALSIGSGEDLKSYKIYLNGEPLPEGTGIVDAGDYSVELFGDGQYAGQTATIEFTIEPIDLSAAQIAFDQGEQYAQVGGATGQMPAYVSKIDGFSLQDYGTATDGKSFVDASAGVNAPGNGIVAHLEFLKAESTQTTPNGAAGSYTYKLSVQNGDGTECTNVVGEKKITVVRYDDTAVIKYDGAVVTGDKHDVDTTSTNHFNKDYISVREDNAGAKKLDYTVSYFKKSADGYAPVEESATQWPGEYYVQIAVADDSYAWGGVAEVEFTVNAVEVQDADAYVTYKGEAFDDGDVVDVYSGEDLMANLSISAYDQDGEKLPADAFDLEVKDEDGNVVTELVDAGDYTATIKEKDESVYRLEDGADPTVEFTVEKVVIDGAMATDDTAADNAVARLAGTMTYHYVDTYTYTGEAIVPTFEYDVTSPVQGYDKAEDWKALPTASYKISFKDEKGNKVDECVEPGKYTAVVTDNAKDDNYVVKFEKDFWISNARVFNDVENDEWYSEYVYEAAKNSWMTGFDGTNFFGPDQQITRGDVAVVLWKMAGKPQPQGAPSDDSEDWYTEQGGWNTGFGDVNGKMYYAEAIAWAKSAELVTGYDGTDSYRPDAFISRQELATMLGRYAEKCKVDVAGAEADLSAYADASSVAPFAEEYVEYAVSAKVMGQDVTELRPADDITRAEVAAMVVRLNGQFDFDLML